ncbi:hypothetical protein NDR87_12035 [Nocardia sp. CDC159]|uniref:Lipoprotein LpqS n=1 Tax=Nocardia pulmonis TaxID=2951408 RepID=A0A9X2IVS9_9NOCA|nr:MULTISPECIES: hypothetical protein [Nocardia]MCM6774202.1 hypothetical protein [Nocardia pulmonis]MCM6787089.1 hypothetical protein [Nocardia sp. CDC159]
MAVRPAGRRRWGGWALLLALAVLTPVFDCSWAGQLTHRHAGNSVAARVAVAPHEPSHCLTHHPADSRCPVHLGRHLPDSVLPAEPGKALPPRLLALLAVIVLVAASVAAACAIDSRGPPVAAGAPLDGRAILTQICIARR